MEAQAGGCPCLATGCCPSLGDFWKLPEATLWEDQEGVGGHLSAVWGALNALVAWQRGEADSRGGCMLGISVPHARNQGPSIQPCPSDPGALPRLSGSQQEP